MMKCAKCKNMRFGDPPPDTLCSECTKKEDSTAKKLSWMGKPLESLTKEELIECIYYAHRLVQELTKQKAEYFELWSKSK